VGLAPTGKAPPCHGARGKPTFAEAMVNEEVVPKPVIPVSVQPANFDMITDVRRTARHWPSMQSRVVQFDAAFARGGIGAEMGFLLRERSVSEWQDVAIESTSYIGPGYPRSVPDACRR
jgi:hypothetical protein